MPNPLLPHLVVYCTDHTGHTRGIGVHHQDEHTVLHISDGSSLSLRAAALHSLIHLLNTALGDAS